jgi:hypothetical protein
MTRISVTIPGYDYDFSVRVMLSDGLERESKIVWTAPLSFDSSRPNVSVHLEMGWFACDDVVLLAEAVDVLYWSWHSKQLNTSNRLVIASHLMSVAVV